MTDLTTLSIIELNILVAKHQGYTVKQVGDNWIPYSPRGKTISTESGAFCKSEKSAWYRISRVKYWCQNIDSVMPLFTQIPGGEIEVDHNQWLVSAYGLNPQSSEEGDLSNEALARCIVLMWLEWKESEGKP